MGDGNTLHRVVLDVSPFYPGGGGQPRDRGTIDGFPVTGCIKEADEVQHEISAAPRHQPPFAEGSRVVCAVDKAFRRDSTQQHTGQHLVSAALSRFGLNTVSVHLGADYCGIEVNADTVDSETIESVLELCENWISDNRPVHSHYAEEDDLANFPLRRGVSEKTKDSRRKGAIRIIEIEGVDAVGCGGVHLEQTAGIRAIIFAGQERLRGRIRLKWLIGDRVVRLTEKLYRNDRKLQQMLSASSQEILERVAGMVEKNKSLLAGLKKSDRMLGITALRGALSDNPPDPCFLQLPVGKDGIAGALDQLPDCGLQTAFLIGDPAEDEKSHWGFYDADPARGPRTFRKIIEYLEDNCEVSGGGRPPFWRGVASGFNQEAMTAIKTKLEDFR